MKIREFGECTEVCGNQYALSLYTLTESVRAKDVLEVGMGWGWSSRAFAMSLENRTDTRLVSIDREPARVHAENKHAVQDTGIQWDVLEGNSADVEVDGQFDLIYIDANPYMAHADFLRFYPKLRPGGFIVMDGYGGQIGPTEAVDSLRESYPFTPLSYHPGYAHAVHQKPKPLGKDGFTAACTSCGTIVNYINWRQVDKAAREHSNSHQHNVKVRVEPRDISYMVIQKGAA